MKINIISDIKSEAESIIPYGLSLAAYLKAEVEIIHIIDSRMQQGVSSNYGDSNTITPAGKLSHEEIIEREKVLSEKALDEFLSREVSRLNYPLKVDVRIELNSIENKVTEDLNINPSALLVISKEADHYIFLSQREIIDVCKDYKGLSLLVSPGTQFQKFTNVLLPAGLTSDDFEDYREVAGFMNQFQPVINVIGRSDEKEAHETEAWRKKTETVFLNATVNLKLIDTSDFDDEFIKYVEMIEPDLTLIFQNEQSWLKTLFKKELLLKLVEQTFLPMLFHSR